MPKYFLFMLIALSISFGPAKALFSKCDDDDYQRPTLHEFYSNTDIKKEKGLLKKLCLQRKGEEITTKASWYADKFHGRKTASGELYDRNLYTAAHKTLAFGTYVVIKNLKNGKDVVVKINDRGPFIAGRDLDLSQVAAKKIEMVSEGIANISYQVLEDK